MGKTLLGELLVGGGEAGQLHEREQALAHPYARGREHRDDGQAAAGGALEGASETLAAGDADGAAEEAEIEGGDDDLATVERARARESSFGEAGAALGLEHAVAVGLALAELDGVEGGHAAIGFAEAGGVEDALHALTGVQVVVVAAGVADAVPVVAARARQVGVAGEAARKALLPGTVTGAISTKQATKGHACECIKRLRPGLCRRAPRGTRPRSWGQEHPPAQGR